MAIVVSNSVASTQCQAAAQAVEVAVVEDVEEVAEEEEWAGLRRGRVDLVCVQTVDTLNLIDWVHPVSNRNVQNVELQ